MSQAGVELGSEFEWPATDDLETFTSVRGVVNP
jgi:hypothetical protein